VSLEARIGARTAKSYLGMANTQSIISLLLLSLAVGLLIGIRSLVAFTLLLTDFSYFVMNVIQKKAPEKIKPEGSALTNEEWLHTEEALVRHTGCKCELCARRTLEDTVEGGKLEENQESQS